MRQLFFGGILAFGVIAGIIYVLWTIVSTLYRDWDLGRDVDQIKAESDKRRQERRAKDEARLANGCDHDFTEMLGGFPPNTCRKCGIERERPAGPCDHQWEYRNEAVPCSYCKKCGQRYVSPSISRM
jgi:hypothetical protein